MKAKIRLKDLDYIITESITTVTVKAFVAETRPLNPDWLVHSMDIINGKLYIYAIHP